MSFDAVSILVYALTGCTVALLALTLLVVARRKRKRHFDEYDFRESLDKRDSVFARALRKRANARNSARLARGKGR